MDTKEQVKIITTQLDAFAAEDLISKAVKEKTEEFFEALVRSANDLVWQVANDYIKNYLEGDIFCNYRSYVENQVKGWAYEQSLDGTSYYGKVIRAKILEEHKEELTPLIQNERIEQLELQLKIELARELARYSYKEEE